MPPRNLFYAIVLGALAALAHPFAFAARAARRLVGSGKPGARSKVPTGQWTPELLKRLEWRRFEELCAAYFEALGFRTGLAYSGVDGGVDINLYEQGSESASIIVQCKPWNAHRVGIKPVRGLRGAMASGNFGEGVLVTSGKFTQEARDFAGKEQDVLGLPQLSRLQADLLRRGLDLTAPGRAASPARRPPAPGCSSAPRTRARSR